MTPITPLADAARRLPVEMAVGLVAGALLAAVLIAAFVTVGRAVPELRQPLINFHTERGHG